MGVRFLEEILIMADIGVKATENIIDNLKERIKKDHLKKTEEFAKKFPNYTLIRTENNNFKNIQITIVRDKWALISKSNHPNIHFVIHHPVLRDAIENMLVSMRE